MKEEKQIPRPVRVLSWVSFFADISSEMVYPVIPLFIVGVLKAPAMALGVTEGFAEALVSFVKGWSGWHSDRMGKRLPYVRWGYGLSAAAKPALALATMWPMVTAARGLDRFGKGIRGSARDALIADATTPANAGRSFGYHRMLDTAGAVIGVLLGYGLLVLLPHNLKLIFIIAAVPGFLALGVTYFMKDKPKAIELSKESDSRFKPSPVFLRALGVMTVFALANSSDTFMLLRVHDTYSGYGMVALAYALQTFVYAAFSFPLGVLSDRVGRMPLLVGGWLIYAGVYFGFGYLPGSAVWPLMGFYGIFLAANDGVGKALVADVAPTNSRGTAMGVFYMITGVATLLSGIAAGELWDHVGHEAPFLFGGVMALVAVAMVPFARSERPT